jgi:hypothetical protein
MQHVICFKQNMQHLIPDLVKEDNKDKEQSASSSDGFKCSYREDNKYKPQQIGHVKS